MQIVVEQAQRLDRMITALLDVSRIKGGRFALEPVRMDLAALVRRVVDETRPTLSSHTIELHAGEAPVLVRGDEVRLEQVIQNLLSNAVKYSPSGGPVRYTDLTALRDLATLGAARVEYGRGNYAKAVDLYDRVPRFAVGTQERAAVSFSEDMRLLSSKSAEMFRTKGAFFRELALFLFANPESYYDFLGDDVLEKQNSGFRNEDKPKDDSNGG